MNQSRERSNQSSRSERDAAPSSEAEAVQRRPSRGDAVQRRKAVGQWWSENRAVQARGKPKSGPSVQDLASQGVSGPKRELPHLDAIQQSFGSHDVSNVQAHVGGAAKDASEAIGAEAYATGNSVAFRREPDLHTAAHEAAHVVQQRAGVHLAGGVGREGDRYEQHADAVADRVVQGKSAEDLLTAGAGGGVETDAVQRKPGDKTDDTKDAQDKTTPAPKKTPPAKKDPTKDAAPAMHKIVGKKSLSTKVYIKDTNYVDEDLGYFLLEMEMVKTATGQVYPYQVNCRPKMKGARAQRYISMGADVKSHSFNHNGNRFAEVHYNITVGGPNTTTTSGVSLGVSVGFKDKAETVEAGGSASWTHSTSTSSKAAQNFKRVVRIGSDMKATVKGDDIEKSNPLVIDDDEAGDGVTTIYADWHIHTYGGYAVK